MRRLFLTLLLCSTAQAAYPTAELLSSAQTRSPSLQLAQNELTQAQTGLKRVQNDPLALRPQQLEAQGRLEQAKAGVIAARLALRATLAQELSTLSGAEDDLAQAGARLEIAQLTLNATNLRAKAGAATKLDVDKASTELRNAQNALAQAKAALASAQQSVKTRAGGLPKQSLTQFAAPKLETLKAALGQHPRVLKASSNVKLAQLDLTVKDNDLSAPVEVQAARDALAGAQKTLEDTKDEVERGLLDAWQGYRNAVSALANRERSAAAARQDLQVQSARFGKGLISRLAMLQARSSALEAENAVDSARAALEIALTRLATAANVDVWK